jgi:hypothetical protein
MTADPTCSPRATKQEQRLAAGAVELSAGAQRRDCREPCTMLVQRAGHVVVDVSAAAVKNTSLTTSRWCRSRDCTRRATWGCPCYCRRCYCQSY